MFWFGLCARDHCMYTMSVLGKMYCKYQQLVK